MSSPALGNSLCLVIRYLQNGSLIKSNNASLKIVLDLCPILKSRPEGQCLNVDFCIFVKRSYKYAVLVLGVILISGLQEMSMCEQVYSTVTMVRCVSVDSPGFNYRNYQKNICLIVYCFGHKNVLIVKYLQVF